MATDESLIKFKTNAWKSVGMVASYAQRMHENRGTNRLKNHVELSLCRENITGTRIIDVGIGTGRASLPLARDGYAITGVDVSHAMLDRCRAEAGDAPVDLRLGELTQLPVEDESFDSLIALNVAVHFPNWREALIDWARVVKPGGRLVFDVHSRDHLDAVAAALQCAPQDLLTPEQLSDPSQFMLRITAQEIAEAAEDCGLSVIRLIPYAAVLGGGNVNYWLRESRLWGYFGDRALSWMAIDDQMFEFGAFLEREVVGALSTHATGRLIVVLQKADAPAVTEATLEYQRRVASVFASEPRLEMLKRAVGDEVLSWGSNLRAHLEHPQNLTLFAMALSGTWGAAVRGLIGDLVGPELTARIYDANERQRVDDDVFAYVRTWYRTPNIERHLEYNGIALGRLFEYDLMRDLLVSDYFSAKEPS